MKDLLEVFGLVRKPKPQTSPPSTGPNDWDEDGERKRVREELQTLQSDDLREAGASETELNELQEQIKAVEDALDDYIYMMPEAELDELKMLRERVRKAIALRKTTQKPESPPSSQVEPKSPPVEKPPEKPIDKPSVPELSEKARAAKLEYEKSLQELMPSYNDTHGKGTEFQKNRLAAALKKATDLAGGSAPDYVQAKKTLGDAELVVSQINNDILSKSVYEKSLHDFKTTKYDPVFEIADEEQQSRLSEALGKVTTAAAAEDPDFAQVESMLMLIEPLLAQIPLEIEAAKEEEQRLIEVALAEKSKKILENQTRLAEAIDELDRCAKLTATPLPKYSERLRKRHAAALKMQQEDAVTEDEEPIEELEVDNNHLYFLQLLAEYQDRYLAVIALNPSGVLQVGLKKTYDAAMLLAAKSKFNEAGDMFDSDFDRQLQVAEGEPLYNKVLEQVEVEYERIESDADATMPEDAMEGAYAEAQRLATEEGKFGPAIKLLRGILLLVPKVDAYTTKYKLLKPTYANSQTTKATSAQKSAITAILTAAQNLVKKGEPPDGMKKLDELTVKIKEVATATERRTNPAKCPSVVPKAPGKGMAKFDDAKPLLEDGGITAENVMKMIPKGTVDSWRGNKARFAKGFKYEWEGPPPEKVKYHIHGHTKDSEHDTGNSGTGAVVRIKVGDDWLKSDGTLTNNNYDDDAHIPMY